MACCRNSQFRRPATVLTPVRVAHALWLLLTFGLISFGQAPSPTNPATEQLKNWLAAFDGSDWQAYLAFVNKNFVTQPELMLRSPVFRNMTKGFDLTKIEAETPVQVTALVEDRATHQTVRIVVDVEAAEPHRIVKLHPQPIPPAHLSQEELLISTREFEIGRAHD